MGVGHSRIAQLNLFFVISGEKVQKILARWGHCQGHWDGLHNPGHAADKLGQGSLKLGCLGVWVATLAECGLRLCKGGHLLKQFKICSNPKGRLHSLEGLGLFSSLAQTRGFAAMKAARTPLCPKLPCGPPEGLKPPRPVAACVGQPGCQAHCCR